MFIQVKFLSFVETFFQTDTSMNRYVSAITGYILLFFVLLSGACTAPSDRDLLDRAESCLRKNPDSTLLLLKQIRFPERLTGKELADYWYLHATGRRNTDRSYVTDSLLQVSIDYYAAVHDSARLRDCYRLEAQRQEWLKQFDRADAFYRRAIEVCPHDQQNHIPALYSKLILLYNDHINPKNYPLARQYAHKLLSITTDPEWRADTYYELAASYNFEGLHPDSAVYYTYKCLELVYQMPLQQRPFYLSNCANMIGLDAHEALRLSDEAIAINPERYLFSSTSTKGYIYLAMGKPDSALLCYQRAAEAYKKEVIRIKEDYPTAHNSLSTLYAATSYALSPKDIRTKEFIYNDSINTASFRQRLINSEHVQNQQVLLEKQYTLNLHQQQLKLLLTGILCAVILAGGILYLYIRNRRQRWVASEEKAEALEHLLNEARKNMAEEPAADGAFFRRILLKQLGLIRLLASSPTSANQELLRQIANPGEGTEKGNRLLTWEELYPIIDASYNGFYTKLTNRYGELLNEKEIQLCCLLCAGFTTKEINVVTGQSISTIYHRKIDIRRKMDLDETKGLADFIQSVYSA